MSRRELIPVLVAFCRALRAAGIPVAAAAAADAAGALRLAGFARESMHTALRAILVTRREQFGVFDAVFEQFFSQDFSRDSHAKCKAPEAVPPLMIRGGRDGGTGAGGRGGSLDERFATRDFEQMSPQERRLAESLVRRLAPRLPRRTTRRDRPSSRGRRYDLRATLRSMQKTHGEAVQLAKRVRRERPAEIVVICDISGSMSVYSRMLLHFAHALARAGTPTRSFVFATRLTHITPWMRDGDVDCALDRVTRGVVDWDGGTRIAASLRRFNVDWSRRVLSRGALVLLISDGLERDAGSDLAFEVARLRRSCAQLLWLNPLLRYRGFEPKARGISAMLPHVDALLPAHDLDSLAALGQYLESARRRAA